jgi:hypothetical protein
MMIGLFRSFMGISALFMAKGQANVVSLPEQTDGKKRSFSMGG